MPFQIEAMLEFEDRLIKGEVKNLSLKGMFVETDFKPEINTRLTVTILLTGDDVYKIHLLGQVVRILPEGIGIFFEEMDLDSFTHLSKILEYNSADPEKVQDELVEYVRKNLD